MEREVDNQVAAPAERPTCTERTKIAHQSADGRMATVANSAGEKPCPTKKQKNPLDSDRPSHGRRYHSLISKIFCGRSNTSSPCPNPALSPDAAIFVLVLLSGRAFPTPRSEFPWFGRRPRVEQVDPEALLPDA